MFVLPLSRPALRTAPQFSRVVDRLFDESFDRFAGGTAARSPALDVNESDTAYTVVFDVPGVTREQLDVSVLGRRVDISTSAAPKAEAAGATDPTTPATPATRALYRERPAPRYARSVVLPAEVDQSSSQARFENGVLTLTLAKKVATGATRISIS